MNSDSSRSVRLIDRHPVQTWNKLALQAMPPTKEVGVKGRVGPKRVVLDRRKWNRVKVAAYSYLLHISTKAWIFWMQQCRCL